MVHHLQLQARRPPPWLFRVPREQQVTRLRAALGVLASDVSLRWQDDSLLCVRLRYEPHGRDGRAAHDAVLAAVVRAVDRAGMLATGALVTRVATHWAQGAVAGALTGLGLGQTRDEELRPAIALAAVAVGALAGALLRREVPVYRAVRLPTAGWRLLTVEPEASSARFRVGLA